MPVLKGSIFVAWTNTRFAFANDEETAIANLLEDCEEGEPYRVALAEVELPEIGEPLHGTASPPPKGEAGLKLVAGTDAE